MTMEVTDDTTHEALTRKRDDIVRRLMRALGAIDRRRQAVAHIASDVAAIVPRPSDPSAADDSPGAARSALLGAAAGGAVVALALLVQHRQRERRKPLRVLQRAWFKYAMPPRPSLLSRVLSEIVGSLAMSVASEAARAAVQRVLEARMESEGPEILDRVSGAPDPTFVTAPVPANPVATPETALAPTAIAPPDPIAPLPSPLREFA